MTKFVIRRLIQSIPTIIGITIISFYIMQLAPGDPLSQITLNPDLTPLQRTQIRDALGLNDPTHLQYINWLFGDSPYVFNEDPAWAVTLDNGDVVIIDVDNGNVRETVTTEDLGGTNYAVVNAGRAPVGDDYINNNDASAIALGEVEGATVTTVQFMPYYKGFVLWGGITRPVIRGGFVVGEEPGTNQGILRGDFGRSFSQTKPVIDLIEVTLPATAELGLISLAVGLIIGIPIGVLAAVWQGSIFDQVTRISAVLVSSIPVFWLGLILLLIFGATLELLPMGNRYPIRFSGEYTFEERISHLILPVFTLSSFTIATFSRFMRASLLNVLSEDYVRTARAKGLSDRKVWFKHALRNALIPIATLLGPQLAGVLTGAVLTETIYAWPGMGRLVVNSVQQLDYPVIMAIVLLSSILTIIGYLISDILYAVFDPRIRLN